jgi:hypothetical protein
MLGVAVDGIMHPTGSFTEVPRPAPNFKVPRNGRTKTFEFRTRDGRGNVRFSHAAPASVPATAFTWLQDSGASPNAVGRLRYNGGCDNCPNTFTFTVSATDGFDTRGAQVELTMTFSTAIPNLISITRTPGDTNNIEPRFDITFEPSTFDSRDRQLIAIYSGGLRYRLLPDAVSSLGPGTLRAAVPRMKLDRSVQIGLINPFGQATGNVQLPAQSGEGTPAFECINCSTPCVNCSGAFTVPLGDNYSISHNHFTALGASGNDEVRITPLQTGATPCNQQDFIYTGSRISILSLSGNNPPVSSPGSVSITSQPPTNEPLRSSNNSIRVAWSKPGLVSDWWYQVAIKGARVLGVCSNRVVQ